MNEQDIDALFGDDQPKQFGTGWWAGVIATFVGVLVFGDVLCPGRTVGGGEDIVREAAKLLKCHHATLYRALAPLVKV